MQRLPDGDDMRIRNLCLFVPALCWACASDKDCSAQGCIDGVEVQFKAPLPAPDLYVKVLWDDNDVQCEITTLQDTCRTQGVAVDISGGSAYGFRLLGQHPEKVTFSFSDINNVLVSATLTLKYETQRPNGPGCPPVCKNASAKL